MECVTPVVTFIVGYLMVPVKEHLGFFFSSTTNVRNMNERLQNLNEAKHEVEEKKNDASRNDRLIPGHVLGWLEQVERVKEEAETINLNNRYEAGKGSLNIVEKIEELLKKQKKIEWPDKQRPLGMVISPSGPSTSETFYDYDITQNIFPSRERLFYDVLELLEADNETQMVGLWGMGGVGKTTMMEDIEKVAKKRGMFKWVVRKTIGTKYDPIATQEDIAKHVGVTLGEENIEDRAIRLGNSFEGMSKNGEKILVILDDVWEAIKLKDIGLTGPFPKGFKLLVTSRNEKVCTKMNVETKAKVFKMVGIEEAEAKSFFWKTVGLLDADGELRKIGEDILKKCGGLPIAIKTIAEALKNEEKDAWEVAQKNLQRHNLKDIDNLDGVAYTVFHISYEYLKKDDDKTIFVLCGLFQDDFDISLEELVRFGWGLQFFKKVDSLDEARKRASTSVRNLIRANLLTESNKKGCVRMHDLARAFVLDDITKFKQASIVNHGDKSEWPTQDTRESCERILLTCKGMSEFPGDFCYPNLELLKIMDGNRLLKLPEDFHKRMEKLKVIAYDKMQNPLFLASLQCSSSLRTLFLDSCSLVDNDLSFLGELVNLEVLSLAHCKTRKLPSTIGKLKRLKLLDLTGCVNLCIDDGILVNLKELEEIYMRASIEKPVKFTDANCDELKVLSEKLIALEFEFLNMHQPKNLSFKKLQRFRISLGCSLNVETKSNDDRYSFKNTLNLTSNRSDIMDCTINELFSKTEELRLSVKDMIYVDDILPTSQNSTFSQLKVLHVSDCRDLTHLFTIPVANGLKLLESLTVSSCPALKSLSLSNGVKVMELPQLVELKLHDLPSFTSIVPEYDISATQPLFNREVMFPKMSKLTVDRLKKLKKIWDDDITSGEEDNVSMLREIVVVDCDCLVNLFPRNPMRSLSHLEEIKVKGCCSVEVLFNIDLGKTEQHRNTSSLRRIHCEKLEELTEVWRINEENKSGDLVCDFKAVKTIIIRGCQKFRNVLTLTPTTANFDTGSIMEIFIEFDNNDAKDMKITDIAKDEDNMSIVAYPSYHLTHVFHDLRKIQFQGLKEVEVMFEMECPSTNRELVTTQQQPLPLLPYLQELELHDMDTLSHVWKCNNWNELFTLHKHQAQSSFQNLTTIYLNNCNNIKYLFSPLMSKLLSSLKTLDIFDCRGMEEIVLSKVDDEEDAVLTASTYTLFPYLKYMLLIGLDSLKHIGGVVAKRETNVIRDQSKSGVIPSYAAATQMHNVQELTIHDCGSLVGVFESEEINNININDCSSSNFNQGSLPLPRHNNINTMRHDLTNLKSLEIYRCDLLEYVFTFSTLESLKSLKELYVYNCESLKVIVREENGEESLSKVVLPRLDRIELTDLPKLEGFFLGRNVDFEWPSLDYVKMKKCPQMMVFTNGESTAPNLKYIHTRLGKHNLGCGLNFRQTPTSSSDNSSLGPAIAQGTPWSFHNLVQIDLLLVDLIKKIVPSNELLHLQNLEEVFVNGCEDVEEVFEVTSEVTNNESQPVVIFPKLREVGLYYLHNLKYIWKSNEWTRLEFPRLTRLVIGGCKSLEYVFTPSMAGSLMHLHELDISRCRHMEVIIKKEEECDGKLSDIALPYLQFIKLEDLPSLKGVCLGKDNLTLSSLNTLVIKKCTEIEIFSEGCVIAPELKLVETDFGFFHVGEDINSFIMTKKQEGFVF